MKSIISLFFCLLSIQMVSGQVSEVQTSDPLTVNEDAVRDFRADSDFDYQVKQSTGPNVLQRIWDWFLHFLFQLLNWGGNSSVGKLVIYGLCIGAIIYALLKMTNTTPQQLFSSPNTRMPYQVHEENIHQIPFEDQIAEALEKHNFKLAVRLNYLFALKILSDRGVISWSPSKSNHDYLYEIPQQDTKNDFQTLSTLFEYCWYGGFDVTRVSYNESKTLLDQLRR